MTITKADRGVLLDACERVNRFGNSTGIVVDSMALQSLLEELNAADVRLTEIARLTHGDARDGDTIESCVERIVRERDAAERDRDRLLSMLREIDTLAARTDLATASRFKRIREMVGRAVGDGGSNG